MLPACGAAELGDAELVVLPACDDAELLGLGLGLVLVLGLGLGLALGLAELEGVAEDLVLFAGAVGLTEPVLVDPAELVVGRGSGCVVGVDAAGAAGSSDATLEAGWAGDVAGGVGPWLVHVLAWTK